jgi:hypothetical protein
VYDAPVIEEVESLGADERGFVLGVLAAGGDGGAAGGLAAPARDRCEAALRALAQRSDDERATERAALTAAVAAPVPEGLAEVHPGWIRRALEGEASDVMRAVARGLPDAARRVAGELLAARGESLAEGAALPEGPGLVALRRGLLAGLAPMPGAAGPGLALARGLCALSSAALLDEIDRRGAAALGLALAGAPAGVVARAAAAAGEPLAQEVLAAARGPAPLAARAEARALVAAGPTGRERGGLPMGGERGGVRAVGLRAIAGALAPEGAAALAAVAQRLPPAVGDALLACAPHEAS